MPTLTDVQNLAALVVLVASIAAMLGAIWFTVDWCIALGQTHLMSEKGRG